jgi:hypothetical protein
MDYRLVHLRDNNEGIGGMYQKSPDGPSLGGILTYFGVDSVDATVQKILDHGGQIMQPKLEIPDVGYMAVAADPDGNVFALFQGLPEHVQRAS